MLRPLRGVAYGANQFVVVTQGIIGDPNDESYILTSGNGENWFSSNANTTDGLLGVGFGNNRWVAVGEDGVILSGTHPSGLVQRAKVTDEHLYAVAYGDDQWVAVGDNGTILTSPDGFNWAVQDSEESRLLYSVAYANGRWVAVGNDGAVISSSDGENWLIDRVAAINWRGLTYANDQWIAVGEFRQFTVAQEPTRPSAPTVNQPTSGSTVGSRPTFSGTAEAGSTVTVTDGDNNELCTATAGDDGAWSCPSTRDLAAGPQTVSVTASNDAGESEATTREVTVDTTAPGAPTVNEPAAGGAVNTPRPPISGTADPNSSIVVADDDGNELCTATASATGAWSCTPTSNLDEGPQTLAVTATNALGNPSPATPHSFTVDTTPPDAPTITGPAAGDTTGLRPTFSGTAEPGSTVTVSDDDGNELCTATAGDDGAWSCTSTSDLDEGPQTVRATATDAAGNTSPAATRDFTVEAGPDAPTITGPAAGSTTGPRPTFSGTAEPGSTVTVSDDDGNELCTATASTTGAWSCTATTALPAGPQTVRATATDAAGNTSPEATRDFTVEAGPDAPVITGPAAGSTTGPRPTFSGTAEPGSTVTVSDDDGNELCTATASATGAWSCQSTRDLPAGPQTVSVTATDDEGNTSPAATREFTVAEPTLDAPTITGPAAGSTTGPRPTFSGTAAPGSTVTVSDDEGNPLCTATTAANGTWSCPSTRDLPEGPQTVNVTATDDEGNTSPAATREFTVAEPTLDAPTITGPAAGSTTGPRPTFSGTAEPGNTVVLTDDEGNPICRATADAAGNWSCAPSRDLPETMQSVTATAIDPDGRRSPPTTQEVKVDPSARPSAPIVDRPAAGSTTSPQPVFSGTAAPGGTVIVADPDGTELCRASVRANGAWACGANIPLPAGPQQIKATLVDPKGRTSPETTRDFNVDADANPDRPVLRQPAPGATVGPRPRFSGVAAPGNTVSVRDPEGDVLCTAIAERNGHWSCPSTRDLPNGPQEISATAEDAAGKTSDPTPRTVNVDGNPPAAPTLNQPAEGATVSKRPTFSGTAEPESTVTVRDDDGKLLCTTTASADGTWSCASNHDLPEGEATVQVTATDPVGNTSPAITRSFKVDPSKQPEAALINEPAEASTVSPRPTISGTAAPGSRVTVVDDEGNPICSTTATTNGTWACVPRTPLAEGEQRIRAIVTAPDGTTSEETPRSFKVDPTAGPTAPTLITPTAGSTTDRRPLFSGTAEPGTTVLVEDPLGNPVCLARTAADGSWSCQPDYDMDLGPQQVVVSARDDDGQHSAPITRNFNILYRYWFPVFAID
ncbi:hypothetical protein CJ255_09665 [Candidatus Viridilinea mediisalina]|uniref:Bacterial Ig-like domain-containing protein n=2 Tax=Candidatus Viridilinea mediisalina TaxID=2024553 RepID=A0A2A6RJW8_9CHLR|nr:hypothetical protein CJ255_09665 [Candidatus Viridilinea mediisalina]